MLAGVMATPLSDIVAFFEILIEKKIEPCCFVDSRVVEFSNEYSLEASEC